MASLSQTVPGLTTLLSRCLPALCCALVLGLSSCASGPSWVERGKEYYLTGNFYQAFHCLRSAKAEGADSREVNNLYRNYRIAYLLKRAQLSIFANQDVRALEDLAKVRAVDPDNKIAAMWSRRAREKLARIATASADEKVKDGDLEGALLDYHEALGHVAGFSDAEEGISNVSAEWRRRREKANDKYLDGVRALADQLFSQTRYHMLIALVADPTMDNAERSKLEAERQLRRERFERVQGMIDEGYYGVALHECQALAEVDPELPDIDVLIAQLTREVEAADFARAGQRKLYSGDYAEARALFDKAFDASVSEKVRYNDLLLATREREFEDRYVLAKDQELQGDLVAAVASYKEIDEEMPAFLDVKARLNNLEAAIALATEAYDAGLEAEAAKDGATAIEKYSEALLYYPGFRDAAERVDRLRQAESESAPAANSSGS